MKYSITCKANKKIFPPGKDDELGFMICAYTVTGECQQPFSIGDTFTAKGKLLPYASESTITLYGDSVEKNGRGENTLICTGYSEAIPNTEPAIRAYLETLPQCESEDANRILNTIPDHKNLIGCLDNDDGTIIAKAVKNPCQAQRIYEAHVLRRKKKEEFFFLLPYLSKNDDVADVVHAAIAAESIDDIKADPFSLSVKGLLPYRITKAIAKHYSISPKSRQGIMAAIIDVLLQGEGQSAGRAYDEEAVGNTYTPLECLKQKVGNEIGISMNDPIIMDCISELVDKEFCCVAPGNQIYRKVTCEAEYGIAAEVLRLMSGRILQKEYKLDIYALENRKKMRLAPEQRNAVKVSLSNPLTLLIGGPGTGKSATCFHVKSMDISL